MFVHGRPFLLTVVDAIRSGKQSVPLRGSGWVRSPVPRITNTVLRFAPTRYREVVLTASHYGT